MICNQYFCRKHRGGGVEIESGSGDITLKTGVGSTNDVGGNINIVASTSAWNQKSYNYNYNYNYNYYDNEAKSREINFGFDEVSDDSTTQRQISLQLKSSKNSTRLISTVPIQVTTIQYSSDERIKKDITGVKTGELLDRMRQIQLREYGESNESSFVFFMSPPPLPTFLFKPIYSQAIPTNGDSQGAWRRMMLGSGE